VANQTKACIACAESIQVGAKLCKHCGTLQDDKRFAPGKVTSKSKAPSPTKPKPKVAKAGKCIRCLAPSEPAADLCSKCYYYLSRRELQLYDGGKDIELCPKCENLIYSPELSDQCHKCEQKNNPRKVNFFISWWAQLIVVAIVLINPQTESFLNPYVFWLNVGAQLFGWNIFISIAFAIAFFVIRRRRGWVPQRTRSWLFSSLVSGALGFLILILAFGFIGVANG
jgi:hypothetical protein